MPRARPQALGRRTSQILSKDIHLRNHTVTLWQPSFRKMDKVRKTLSKRSQKTSTGDQECLGYASGLE